MADATADDWSDAQRSGRRDSSDHFRADGRFNSPRPDRKRKPRAKLARLTSKYGAELNGSAIGVHKAVVNGETIYRLRVVGLTKADAAALCARLKGEGGECFIAK